MGKELFSDFEIRLPENGAGIGGQRGSLLEVNSSLG